MTYYTVVPPETLFDGLETYEPALVEVQREGLRMWIDLDPSGEGRLVRITSTDPADYLRPAYAPGSRWLLEPVPAPGGIVP